MQQATAIRRRPRAAPWGPPPGWRPANGRGAPPSPSANGHDEERMAKFLGWFSIGLGLAEFAAPEAFARWIGIEDPNPTVVRAVGAREITAGVGILAQPRPAPWLWARVGGDAMDLAILGRSPEPAADADNPSSVRATAAVVGVTRGPDVVNG